VLVGVAAVLDADVTLDSVGVYDTKPGEGDFGQGIHAQEGATLTVLGCTIQGNASQGVQMMDAGTIVNLVDTAVLESPDGVEVDSGTLTATRCTFQRTSSLGVVAASPESIVELVDTEILDGGGYGVEVIDGATLSATSCTLQRNTGLAVLASTEGTTVELVDTAVLDTATSADGTNGRGISVQQPRTA
jgi:hypothetical protein